MTDPAPGTWRVLVRRSVGDAAAAADLPARRAARIDSLETLRVE